MNELEKELKILILERYGTMKAFCDKTNIAWSTMNSILQRGINTANIQKVITIAYALNIDVDALAAGEIKSNIKIINNRMNDLELLFMSISDHLCNDNFILDEKPIKDDIKYLIKIGLEIILNLAKRENNKK